MSEWSPHYERVLQLTPDATTEELRNIYATWSDSFDKFTVDIECVAPTITAEKLVQKLKGFGYGNDVNILDLGCGTGAVGEELQKRGYEFIDGLDISPEMLEKARTKSVYKKLSEGAMGSDDCKDLGISPNQYDAAICVGVFVMGHVKAKGFDDLLYVLKQGGLACFTIRDCIANDPHYGYNEKMKELTEGGKWKLVGKTYERYHNHEPKCWVYIYQKL